ncbi:MAG: hypothetical protein ACOH18_01260 [Candidatus Saccharimonadaceae bacterium]
MSTSVIYNSFSDIRTTVLIGASSVPSVLAGATGQFGHMYHS